VPVWRINKCEPALDARAGSWMNARRSKHTSAAHGGAWVRSRTERAVGLCAARMHPVGGGPLECVYCDDGGIGTRRTNGTEDKVPRRQGFARAWGLQSSRRLHATGRCIVRMADGRACGPDELDRDTCSVMRRSSALPRTCNDGSADRRGSTLLSLFIGFLRRTCDCVLWAAFWKTCLPGA
jgi:hypothetical protein